MKKLKVYQRIQFTGSATNGKGGDVLLSIGSGNKFNGGDIIVSAGETTAVARKSMCTQHVENAGGLDKIDALQQHEDNSIYEKALKILECYFGAVDDGNEAAGPSIVLARTT